MEQKKVKGFYAATIKQLEDKINEYICEDIDECEVIDIKYSCTVEREDEMNCHYCHFALLIYI